jgi:putative ABC transport system ATP-binding protein
MSVLELRDVHRTHGDGDTEVQALRGLSLCVGPGELACTSRPTGSARSSRRSGTVN